MVDLADRPYRRYALIVLVAALVLAIWGIASRVRARDKLGQQAAQQALPVVTTLKPTPNPPTEDLILPGSVQAFFEAPIYARTSGYLKSWRQDIGDRVKQGQLLAEIDTPEVDQQLAQSQANLQTALANAQLAKVTNDRWKGLLQTQSVSRQDADTKASDAATANASVSAAQADLNRLRDLESFKRLLAPFDGVVTQRNTDVGALISAGETSGQALFRVADIHKLRIYVLVPEPYAAQTVAGVTAELHFAEHPGKIFDAQVVGTAHALDPTQRTLQVQLLLDNPTGELFPGAYAEVHFKLPANTTTSVRIPSNTLLFRAAGLQVAVVGADRRVHLKDVTPGRDFGSYIEVLAGLSAQDDVVVNPPDSITDGEAVTVAAPSNKAPAANKKS